MNRNQESGTRLYRAQIARTDANVSWNINTLDSDQKTGNIKSNVTWLFELCNIITKNEI